mmetsp:Transcript_15749/g.16341  ORF Transcript_15749/g.16341 Transcript_15749/m.16341 type:complete len:210 (+) Transcript_15749:3-632(+)
MNDSRSENVKYSFKVIVLGNISVGKTSLTERIVGKGFKQSTATVGVEFEEYEVKSIEKNVDISLQLWDTSGAERYRAVTTSHIRNADGVLLVFDLTDSSSFESLDFWLDSIRKFNNDDILIYLLGNKSDKEEERDVSEERILEFKERSKIDVHYEISAKANTNISEMFKEFYNKIYNSQKDNIEKKQQHLRKQKEKRLLLLNKEKSKCC